MDTFAAVVVAVSTRSMEIDIGLSLPTGDDVNLGDADLKDAMRNLFHTGSSKMLIRTGTKFWLDQDGNQRPDIPQTIQTDELPRGVYCLNYPHTQQGVVIVSYTWGDDSTKLASVEPVRRFARFKEVLARICPPFADNLVPANGERDIFNVDWESAEHYYGAFKLQLPGQDRLVQDAYYQYLSVLKPESDPGVYLVGDSVSWSGGWVEGALQTGVNAACAVARRLGGSLAKGSPLKQNPKLYTYTL
jgi:tryptophan 2-monooxygenase